MTLKRNTVCIMFISKMETNATEIGERIEVRKTDWGWELTNQLGEKFNCPTATLRILMEHGEDVRQFDKVEEWA